MVSDGDGVGRAALKGSLRGVGLEAAGGNDRSNACRRVEKLGPSRVDGAASPPAADACAVLCVLAIFILQRSLFLLSFISPCVFADLVP